MDKHESVHHQHEVTLYVPCFQRNDYDSGPTFTYDMSQATQDQQMAASFDPDYILVLKGKFDAKTQPWDRAIVNYNLTSGENE